MFERIQRAVKHVYQVESFRTCVKTQNLDSKRGIRNVENTYGQRGECNNLHFREGLLARQG